jgi:non-specific serine/threonine protein kinase
MSDLQIELFGDFQIRYQGEPLAGFDAPRLQSLVSYLLVHRDAAQSRKHLAFMLWQDSTEQQALGNLRSLVLRLRKALPDAERFLASDNETLQWRGDAPFTCDIVAFLDCMRSRPATNASLSSAVSLYRGDLLPACYDDWVLPERERMRELYTDALTQLILLAEQARDYPAGIGYARQLLRVDPVGEETYRRLMTFHARTGDRAGVVRVYQTCVAVLKRELDVEPGPLTRELFEQLRHEEPSAAAAAQLHPSAQPNMPVSLTNFVGRTQELGELSAMLGRARLTTLTGAGGCGKTRLAIQAAREAAPNFPDGVWFVDLAPLTEAAAVPSTCTAVFGIREQIGANDTELLTDYLRDKELLLLLDNCEHLGAGCAALAQSILQAAPRVRIVATSRVPLNLPGETLVSVPPLSLPADKSETLEALYLSDAVQLFVARAAYAMPSFMLTLTNAPAVLQICRRLDGMPLAIELAAARIRSLTPQQLAARLDHALTMLTRGSMALPERHQTLRAVLDWSDTLLSGPERVLFRRLAIFAGGFTLEAAEHVCGNVPGSDPLDILELLSNLIDKSLVTVREMDGEMRYRMLEPIREYAREKLAGDAYESRAVAARHLEFFMQLAERAEPELTGPLQGSWLKRLEAEHDNLRAALSWSEPGPEYDEQRLRLAGAVWRFWDARGSFVQGQLLLERALEAGEAAGIAARAKGYEGLGAMAWLRGEYMQSIELHRQALVLYREIGDARGIALALSNIGGSFVYLGEYNRALEYFEESLALARGLAPSSLLTTILTAMGELARYRGDYTRAYALAEEALRAATEIEHIQHIALALNNFALLATRQQEFERALRLHRQSLELYRTVQEIRFLPEGLQGLAAALNRTGQTGRAAVLLGAADALRTSIGLFLPPIEREDYERVLGEVQVALQDRFEAEWDRGHSMSSEQAIDFALEE